MASMGLPTRLVRRMAERTRCSSAATALRSVAKSSGFMPSGFISAKRNPSLCCDRRLWSVAHEGCIALMETSGPGRAWPTEATSPQGGFGCVETRPK